MKTRLRALIPGAVVVAALLSLFAPRVDTQTTLANNAASLSGKTVLAAENSNTVTGLLTFDRGAATAPFAVNQATAAKVSNLDADELDGNDSTYYAPSVVTTTATGTQNDLALTLTGRHTVVRCNNASALTITGFTAGSDGQMVTFVAINANVFFDDQAAGSTAALRMINAATSGNTPISAKGYVSYIYDATTARWRLVSHEQGTWITPTFAAGDFTGNASTWGVDAADISVAPGVMKYRLTGKTLNVSWYISNTDVGAGNTFIRIANGQWGGFTSTHEVEVPIRIVDNGASAQTGMAVANPSGAFLHLYTTLGGGVNWTATAADNALVTGNMSFEVD